MIKRSLYLVSYDIRENRKRSMALKAARSYATGGQKSVHECWMTDAERKSLLADLIKIIDRSTDRILLLRLDPRQAVTTIGCAVQPLHPDFLYIG